MTARKLLLPKAGRATLPLPRSPSGGFLHTIIFWRLLYRRFTGSWSWSWP